YRRVRQKEQDRIAEFSMKREERMKAAEERTAKKRLKRQKKKQRKKEKKPNRMLVEKSIGKKRP
ncbi:hypothetical protein CISIN_1g0324451mg, partial [Citrus sinensis]